MSSISEEEFIQLVRKAEQETATNPRRYLVKLALFAVLGYVVIFGALLTLLGLVGGLLAAAFFSTALILFLLKKKLIFVLLLAIWVLLRALWVRFEPPDGYELKRKDFPRLFDEIDQLSTRLKALKIHRVILDRRLNAAVVQHPRLGIFGWHRNYLVIGYPLMLTLSPEEMRSVLAHEFGHLSGNHSRFHGWIYRVRLTWMQVMSAYEGAESWGASLLRKFFDWYSPKFEVYSFALARSNEYEADGISAELTSPETAARALVNVYATAPYIDDHYWQRERFEYVTNAREQLEKFESKSPSEIFDDDLWDYACWSREFVSDEKALPLFRAYLERKPDALGAAYYLGCILLDQGDEAGLAPLARARTSPSLLGDCAYLGYQFLIDQGRQADADAWWQAALDQQAIFIAADQERQAIGRDDTLVQPEIATELLEQLVANLKRQSNVGKVWLAQKQVNHFPDDPVYVVAFKAKGFFSSYEKLQARVAKQLDVDGHFFVACRSGESKSLAKKVIKKGKRIC